MGMLARRAGSMQNYVAKSRPLGTCLRAAVLITSRPSHLLANLPGMRFVIWSWGRAALSVRAARERGADRGRVVVRTTRARRRVAWRAVHAVLNAAPGIERGNAVLR
jgi:hypothetical protein